MKSSSCPTAILKFKIDGEIVNLQALKGFLHCTALIGRGMPGWLKLLRDHTQNILPVRTRAQKKKKDKEEVQDQADNSGAGTVDLEEIQDLEIDLDREEDQQEEDRKDLETSRPEEETTGEIDPWLLEAEAPQTGDQRESYNEQRQTA